MNRSSLLAGCSRILVLLLLSIAGTAVAQDDTTSTSLSVGSPRNQNQAFTLTATITNETGMATPVGTVAFSSSPGGSISGCASVAVAAGSAQCATVSVDAGTYSFTADYTAGTGFDDSTDTATGQIVSQTSTTLNVSAPFTANVGADVVVTATVSESAPNAPTGQVDFSVVSGSAISNCQNVSIDGSQQASCNTSFDTAGTYQVAGDYGGDTNFTSSSGQSGSIVVSPIAPGTVSLNLNDGTPAFGQTITFSGTVASGATTSAPTPTGSVIVEFTDGTDLCTDTLNGSGAYSCNATFPAAGSVTIRASYGGDGAYNSGTSSNQPVTVIGASTSTTITSRPMANTPALALFNVAVEVATTGDGSGLPTGTVDVSWGSDSCTINLTDGTPADDDVAEGDCNVPPTAVATRTLSATFNPGDGNFLTSTDSGSGHAVEKASVVPTIDSVTSGAVVGGTVTVEVSLSSNGTETPDGDLTGMPALDPVFAVWGTDSCSMTVTGSPGSYTGSCDFTPSEATTQDVEINFVEDDFNLLDAGVTPPVSQSLTVGPAQANVGVQKCVASPGETACPGTPRTSLNPNEDFVYLLVVSRGAAPTGVDDLVIRINDMLPVGLLGSPACASQAEPCWEVCTSDGGIASSILTPDNCPGDAATGTGNVTDLDVSLAPNSSTTVVINAEIPSNETGPVDNTASVAIQTSGVTESDATDNTSMVSVTIDRSTDIQVTKTDGLVLAVPGTRHSYDITVTNAGFIAANELTLTDTLPSQFVAGSGTWTCAASGGACCLSGGASGTSCGDTEPVGPFPEPDNILERDVDLPSGSSLAITFSGDLAADATGTLDNTVIAELPAGLSENSPDNACVSDGDGLDEECGIDDDTVLVAQGRLVIEHNAVGRIELGADQYTGQYTIEVSNEGPSDATAINVTAPFVIPPFKASTLNITQCTLAPMGAGSCPATGLTAIPLDVTFDLDAGATITIALDVGIDGNLAAGPIVNTATVDWPGNTNSDVDDIAILQLVRDATISVLVDDGLSGVSGAIPGESLTYVIDISNEGPDNAIGAAVSNVFPPQLDDVTWQCFARTPVPGDLTFLDAYTDAVNLPNVPFLALSPDGAHAYALGSGMTPAVVGYKRVLVRGADFGKLAKIGVERNGESSDGSPANIVLGMSQPTFGLVSGDGRHLYVLSPADNSIVLFTRNRNPASADFGQLGYGSTVTEALLGGATQIAVTSDGGHLYALAPSGTITIFERDSGSGNIAFLAMAPTVSGASVTGGLNIAASDAFVIAATSGGRQVFARETDDTEPEYGLLTAVGGTGGAVASAALSGDSKHFYFQTASGSLRVEDFNAATGILGNDRQVADASLGDVGDITLSADGEHVYISQGAADRIIALRRIGATGAVSDADNQSVANGAGDPSIGNMDNPGTVRVTPDGRHLVIAARDTESLVVLERRAPDPLFEQFEIEFDGVDSGGDTGGEVDGLAGATAVAVKDGFVYVLGLTDSAISVFARDPDAGLDAATRGAHLDFLQSIDNADLLKPVDLVISDNWAFVAAQDDLETNAIRVFARNDSSGLLTYRPDLDILDGNGRLNGVSGLALSPTGSQLYAVAQFDGAINVYDVSGGTLTLNQTLRNGVGGVQGLAGAIDVAVTGDGRHVLTTGTVSDAVAVFERENDSLDPDFGALTWRQKILAAGAWRLAGSPDDRHFYVTAQTEDRLYAVERDAAPSSLSFGQVRVIATYENGVDGVTGLDGPRGVAVDPILGSRVYVASQGSDSAVVFSRNTDGFSAAFGNLAPIALQRDGIEGITGLNGARGVAVAAGGQAYFAALDSGALTAFQLGIGSSCSADGSGSIDDIVTVAKGGAVTYTATGTLRSGAVGGQLQCLTGSGVETAPQPDFLCNVAEVVLDGVIDPIPAGVCPGSGAEGCGIDNNTPITPLANLALTKDNQQVSAAPGETVTYTIEIVNEGPSDAIDSASAMVRFTDQLDPALFDVASATWTCEAVGSGSLSFLQSLGTDAGGNPVPLAGVTALASLDLPLGNALPDLLLSASTIDSSVAAFSVATDGTLTFAAAVDSTAVPSLEGVRAIAVVMRAGRNFVYAAGQTADAVTVLEITDAGGGVPGFSVVQVVDGSVAPGLDQPVDLLVNDARDQLYVASANGDSVHGFDLNPLDGTLGLVAPGGGFVERVDALAGASTLAFDSTQDRLYVGSLENPVIHVLDVDSATGGMALSQTLDATSLDILPDGLSDLAISADGDWLYATLTTLDAVVTFSIEASGALAREQIVDTTSNGGGSLIEPGAMLLSADESQLYVAAAGSDTVFVLNRDQTTGLVEITGSVSERNGTAEGMTRPAALVFGPSGQMHVAASSSRRVATFERRDESSCPSSGSNAPVDIGFSAAAGGRVIFRIDVPVNPGIDPNETMLTNEAQIVVSIDPDGGGTATDIDVVNRIADLAITKSDGIAEIDGLAGVTDVITVRTGTIENVYTAAASESSVGVFSRNTNAASPAFGQLRFEAALKNQVDGVTGLVGVRRLAASPDAAFVHAVSRSDNAVVVFERDATTGALTLVQTVFNGAAGVTGMNGPADAFISPDGAHLYVAAETGNSVVVFDRDAITGNLTFRQAVLNGTGGTTGLSGPVSMVGSSDGNHLYVVSPSTSSVVVFERNAISASNDFGGLQFVTRHEDNAGGFDGLAGARDIAISDDGETAYILGADEASVAVASRNTMTGELTFVERKADGTGGVSGLANADRLALSPDQASLFTAAGATATIGRFTVAADGRLTFGEAATEGAAVVRLGGVQALAFADDESDLYAAASLDNTLNVFSLAGGIIATQDQVLIDGRGGVAPGDTVVYEIGVSNLGPGDATNVRVRDIFPVAFDDVRWFCSTEGGAGCIVCPPAPTYCTGNIDETNVVIPVGGRVTFTAFGSVRPGLTGRLENTATVTAPAGFNDPDLTNNTATDDDTVLSPLADLSVALVPGSADLTPGASADWTLTVLNTGPSSAPASRVDVVIPEALSNMSWTCDANPVPGLLADTGFAVAGPGTSTTALAFGATGQYLYAAGDSAVTTYSRDSASGAITAVQTVRDGVAGVDGIGGAADIQASGDGRFVWVTSANDDSVALFEVDADSGELSYQSRVIDGVGGVSGIGSAAASALSPDGEHLYIAGEADNSIAVFSVSAANGSLTFVGRIGQDSPGVDGLAGVRDILISPDGLHVYAAGGSNSGVAVFERNRTTGLLSFVEAKLGLGSLAGLLNEPASMTMDSDGNWLVVSAAASDALVVFARNPDTGQLLDESFVTAATVPGLIAPGTIALGISDRLLHVQASDSVLTFELTAGTLNPIQTVDGTAIATLIGIGDLAVSPTGGYVYAGSSQITPLAVGEGSFCGVTGRGTLLDEAYLSAGGTVTYTMTAEVMQSARGAAMITANVAPGDGVAEADETFNSAQLLQPLVADLQLTVQKSDNQTRVVAGTDTTYSVQVGNSGVSDGLDLAIFDALPQWPAVIAGVQAGTSSWACSDTSAFDRVSTTSVAALANTRAAVLDSSEQWLLAAAGDALVLLENVAGTWTVAATVADGDTAMAGTVNGLDGASGVAISEDQAHVYVTGADSLAHFTFDDASGALAWQSAVSNGVANPGLRGARAPVLSPDGRQLYVLGETSDAIAIFTRNRSTGALTFLERVRDGFGSLSEIGIIDGPVSMALRSDGRFAYVLSRGTAALSVFSRDAVTGGLDFVEVRRNGDDIAGTSLLLDQPSQLALTSAGVTLYLADAARPDLGILSLDQTTGLPVSATFTSGGSGMGASAMALAADGSFLAPISGNALQVLRREWTTGALTAIGQATAEAAFEPAAVAIRRDRSRIDVLTGAGDLIRFGASPYVRCVDDVGTGDLAEQMDLGPGGTSEIALATRIDPNARGTISNTATAMGETGAGSVMAAGTDDSIIDIVNDLSVAIVQPPEPWIAGTQVQFSFSVSNAGPSSALGATIDATLAADLIAVNWTCSASQGSSCPAMGAGEPDLSFDLLVDGSLEVVATVTVASGAVNPVTVSVAVAPELPTAPATATDGNPTDNLASVDIPVIYRSDAGIVIDEASEFVAGLVGTFEVTVTNNGPSDAAVRLLVSEPSGFAILGWACGSPNCSLASGSGPIDLQLVPLVAGQSVILPVEIELASSVSEGTVVTIDGAVQVLAPAEETMAENNVTGQSAVVITRADVSVLKTALVSAIDTVGETRPAPFRIEVLNAGPSDALDVVMTDRYSRPLEMVLEISCDGLFDRAGEVDCVLGDLPAGDGVIVDILFRAALGANPVTNEASAFGTTDDPLLLNNSSTTAIANQQTVDGFISFNDLGDRAIAGGTFAVELRVANGGTLDAGPVTVDVPVPANVTSMTWTCVAQSPDACAASSGSGALAADPATLGPAGEVLYVLSFTLPENLDTQVVKEIVIVASVVASGDVYTDNDADTYRKITDKTIFINGFEESEGAMP